MAPCIWTCPSNPFSTLRLEDSFYNTDLPQALYPTGLEIKYKLSNRPFKLLHLLVPAHFCSHISQHSPPLTLRPVPPWSWWSPLSSSHTPLDILSGTVFLPTLHAHAQHSLGLHTPSLQVSTSVLSHPLSLNPSPNIPVQVTYLEYLVPPTSWHFYPIL